MSWTDGWQWAGLLLVAYRIGIIKHQIAKRERDETERWAKEDAQRGEGES